MFLTYGGKTIKIHKWWESENEVTYQIISPVTGSPIGGLVTKPNYFLRDNIKNYKSGAFVRADLGNGELIWQRTKFRY